jgi:aminoglycoside phosphotransferase (APT) family kinase protein
VSTPPSGVNGRVLDLRALEAYLAQHVPEFSGKLQAELSHGGRSNLTYRLTDGTYSWVLRRPPLGHVAPTANDIGREHRMVAALESTRVPVARAIAYCDDRSVIGAPFSVVSMVNGRVIRSAADGAALDPVSATRIATALVAVLAAIHAVPYQEVGLCRSANPMDICDVKSNDGVTSETLLLSVLHLSSIRYTSGWLKPARSRAMRPLSMATLG